MARRCLLGCVRRFQLRARLAGAVAPFPLAPLKFRTAGHPQYGFKVALPHSYLATRPARRGSLPVRRIASASSVTRRLIPIGVAQGQACRGWSSPPEARRYPTGPLLAGIVLSHGVIATTTRSAGLVTTPRLACGLCGGPRDDETFPTLGHQPFL